jgi:hypothetical protein
MKRSEKNFECCGLTSDEMGETKRDYEMTALKKDL